MFALGAPTRGLESRHVVTVGPRLAPIRSQLPQLSARGFVRHAPPIRRDVTRARCSAELGVSGSTINGNPNFRGATSVSGTTITGIFGTVVDGLIQIGLPSGSVWDASGTITVGLNALTTDLIVSDSTIESGTAYVRGGGPTHLQLQGAATWRAIDLFHFQGSTVTAEVSSASQIDSLGDLWIGQAQVIVRSGVGTDSRIDVAGDLGLGNFDVDTFTTGTLTIEDGGVVDVEGMLFIRPQAVLNLNRVVLRVGVLAKQGALNENGGQLIVPEAGDAAPLAAGLARVALRRAPRTCHRVSGRLPGAG
jgi:hypothetical protein